MQPARIMFLNDKAGRATHGFRLAVCRLSAQPLFEKSRFRLYSAQSHSALNLATVRDRRYRETLCPRR